MINPKFISFNQLNLSPDEVKKLAEFLKSATESQIKVWHADTPYLYGESNASSIKLDYQIVMRENKEKQLHRFDVFSKEGIPIENSKAMVYPMLGSFIVTKDKQLLYIPNLEDEVIIAMPLKDLEQPFGDTFQEIRAMHPYYSELSFAATIPVTDASKGISYTVVRQVHGEKLSKIMSENQDGSRTLSLEERVEITLELLKALKEVNPNDYQLQAFNWDHVLIERNQPIKVDLTYALPKKLENTNLASKEAESVFLNETGKRIYSLWSQSGDSDNIELPLDLSKLKDFDHLTHDAKQLIAANIESLLDKNARFKHLNETIDTTKKIKLKTAITSEKIHNKNCYSYLKELIEKAPAFLKNDFAPLKELEELKGHKTYRNDVAYAKIYTQLITFLDQHIESLSAKLESEIKRHEGFIKDFPNNEVVNEEHKHPLRTAIQDKKNLVDFINTIYNNDSKLLEQTYAAIKHIPLSHRPTKSQKGIEHTIAKALLDNDRRINVGLLSPADNESRKNRLKAVLGDTFTPQYYTNIPSIRSYGYHENTTHKVRELRIGTQAQRYEGQARISPLFKYWLQNQRNQVPSDEPDAPQITHIYFNNLARDRGTFDFEGNKEKELTQQLENLENKHSNLAVITLPADKGFMDRNIYLKTKAELGYQTTFDTFLSIARQNTTLKPDIKDFYISLNIRKLLFNSGGGLSQEKERVVLQSLLTNSFKAMGVIDSDGNPINPDGKISQAEQQAVWFHFIKFELTNYIINTLKPTSINFSCKDAIDRGGASSAYYNLMKSIEKKHPLSREEFEQALHAASTSVKGRGMNHHLNIIWNAIDGYVNAHYNEIKAEPKLEWLIQWRDFNCPHGRVTKLLQRRIKDIKTDLAIEKANHPEQTTKINQSLKIIETIQFHSEKKVSGKRLLLEAVSLTPTITLKSDKKSLIQYDKLADELRITHPKLQALAGMMKAALGVILVLFSAGRHTSTLTKGTATFKAGYHASMRETLTETMKDHVTLAKQLGMKEFDTNLHLIHKEEDNTEEREQGRSEDHPFI